MNLTLMSLFDGSGGFPLAGAMHGIVPVYAAEVEPYPIAVTRSRFPNMRHLGSVTEIKGAELEPVDVVTFGSPCQDLSVAGLQKGIHDGERSNLFFQAVRIIKELRDKDARTGRTNEHIRPRFAVWENVPGAYSSNGGHDFQAVLQALAEVADPNVSVPFPEKGKWAKAGCIVGDGWSIAWRTLDAQFWGVPQRRKRIYLVADFGTERAGEILFEREGVSGHSEPSAAQGQGTAVYSEGSVGRSDNVQCLNPWDAQTIRQYDANGVYPALMSNSGGGQNRQGIVCSYAFMGGQGAQAGSIAYTENCSPTLRATESGSNQVPDVVYAISSKQQSQNVALNISNTLGANDYKEPQIVCCQAYSFDALASNSMKSSNPHSGCRQVEIAKTLDTSDCNPSKNQGGIAVIEPVAYTIDGCNAVLNTENCINPVVYHCYKEQMLFENHSQDTRYKGPLDVCPMLPAQLGTGGNNTPFVTEKLTYCKSARAQSAEDATTWKECSVTNTLNAFDVGEARCNEVVCIGNGQMHQTDLGDKTGALNCMHDQQAVMHPAKPPRKWIVRRLTPTECARLQGFPDMHGHPDHKDSLTDEEYAFWLNVRNTHAMINGRAQKQYTREQMLKWYNGLHTDSAEYKMWGNGIALPCAAFVLGQIAKMDGGAEE